VRFVTTHPRPTTPLSTPRTLACSGSTARLQSTVITKWGCCNQAFPAQVRWKVPRCEDAVCCTSGAVCFHRCPCHSREFDARSTPKYMVANVLFAAFNVVPREASSSTASIQPHESVHHGISRGHASVVLASDAHGRFTYLIAYRTNG